MKAFIVFCLTVLPASCQLLSLGVKAGIPMGDAYSNPGNVSQARRYLIGGTAELHLPFRFSVELDAIYKRTGVIASLAEPLPVFESVSESAKANQWEFPLLGKYELTRGPIRPFIDAGPVLRHLSGIQGVYSFNFISAPPTSGTIVSNNSPLLANRNTGGFAIGGGVTLKLLHFRISPELRYTRWADNSFSGSTANQADVIVGFTF